MGGRTKPRCFFSLDLFMFDASKVDSFSLEWENVKTDILNGNEL